MRPRARTRSPGCSTAATSPRCSRPSSSARAASRSRRASLLVDVDHFKTVNDTYGHQIGDAVLSEIAARLLGAVRAYDCVARWGGEEFIVLAPALDHERALWRVCQALRESVGAMPVTVGQRRLDVTVSVGGVLADPTGSHELIVDQADRALYSAKRQGRDRSRLFSELTANDLAAEEPEAIRLAQALSLSAGVREGVPEEHAEEVSDLAGAIARTLGLPDDMVLRCRLGGWLHDIGKVAIPDRILVKPGDLDEHEWRIMRTHAEIGEQLVRRIDAVGMAAPGRPPPSRARRRQRLSRTRSRATRFRSRRASWPLPTPSARSRRIAPIAARERRSRRWPSCGARRAFTTTRAWSRRSRGSSPRTPRPRSRPDHRARRSSGGRPSSGRRARAAP